MHSKWKGTTWNYLSPGKQNCPHSMPAIIDMKMIARMYAELRRLEVEWSGVSDYGIKLLMKGDVTGFSENAAFSADSQKAYYSACRDFASRYEILITPTKQPH